jgi:hypothetical protein
MTYNNEDAFLDSHWEERTECDYYEEEAARWEWTGRADWEDDDDEEEAEPDIDCDSEGYFIRR